MRTSTDLWTALEHKKRILKKHESRIDSMKREIRMLENVWGKALRREELAKSGVKLVIASCTEADFIGTTAIYHMVSTSGLKWGECRKRKVGSVVLKTQSEVDHIRKVNEEFSSQKQH